VSGEEKKGGDRKKLEGEHIQKGEVAMGSDLLEFSQVTGVCVSERGKRFIRTGK